MRKAAGLATTIALVLACLGTGSCSRDDEWPGGFTVALVDLQGHVRVIGSLPYTVFAPRVSPDGKQLAFEMAAASDAGGVNGERIWIAPLDQLRKRRPLPQVGSGRNWAPIWTVDGSRLIFVVSGDDGDSLYARNADGSGDAERLVEGRSGESVSPDGREMSFITLAGDRDYGVSMLDLQSHATKVIADMRGTEQHSSTISPDGRWIAYSSNETGVHQIWVEPLPPTGKRYRLTRDGGSHPVWARDGKSVYYDWAAMLYRVAFTIEPPPPEASETTTESAAPTVPEPTIGAPSMLPISGFQQGYRRRQFDLMPDGEHFLLLYPPGALRPER
jgi:Tol biopolymer transport system component